MSELTWDGDRGFVAGVQTFVIKELEGRYIARCSIPSLYLSSTVFGLLYKDKEKCKEAATNALIEWLRQSTQSNETGYSLPA